MNTRKKQKYIDDYCEYRGYDDQCEGCVLAEFCWLGENSPEVIDQMYDAIRKEVEENGEK